MKNNAALTMSDQEVVRKTLDQKRDDDERAAVEAWLAAGNRPTKVRTGESGLWDENGLPTKKGRSTINPLTAERVVKARKMTEMGLEPRVIAATLEMGIASYRSMMARWGTGY